LQESAQIPILKNWNMAQKLNQMIILNFVFSFANKKSYIVVFLDSMPNKILLFVVLQK
jgi:hypothetical protein